MPKARERGEHKRGIIPLSLGGFGGPPPRKVLSASMCVFNGIFMRLGPDFSRFGHKDISCRVRTECWTKLVSDSHMFFFYLFSMSL